MTLDVITIILFIIGISGMINSRMNIVSIVLCTNIIFITIFTNLVSYGIEQKNEDSLTLAFFLVILTVLINSVSATIIYAYFDRKETLEIKESVRDI